MLYYFYLSVLLISGITGVVCWKNLEPRKLQVLVPYLFLTLAIELYCNYIVQKYNASTGWIYNLLVPLTVIVFCFLYYRLPLVKPFRNAILALLVINLVAVIIVYGFFEPIHTFNTYLFLVSGFIIVICGIFFLYQYFQLDSTRAEKQWLPFVWITGGLVIYYSVSSITIALYRLLVAHQVTVWGAKLHNIIPQLLSIILYSCFARAFYLCKKNK